ncbi:MULTISPECIES: type II toxin-antitoxin system RelE/ParE family toxin [Leptolyngbya]|uniref:Type II toxin-antitoxin system RelE/ParE family toxin n=1 Tax=Leptolyngbya boryana CZ1 TaxID=3060204 RepID=A0AA96WVS9_LEPBY|nr:MULTISPECIES: type II toxin-antitoxin system RelE/ParE family toxin [Leptolyngbya]MBN8560771.1 type II toxin-antitoxin system RelE/ParE family toxin [Leptolyngbya sp. UWPOB_LEPTO1]MCY6490925.1 type II toxin-antitoxin system RelE/ParE family toxin [Leptolyngbya sp. GGD]WNZ46397.1 type II toxin-antitoxin system RelE/ParE family toxin [Leptolyngbya boryana CZ1]
MSFVLIVRPEARQELDEAYQWYEAQQEDLGDDFLDCVDERLNQICQMPELYEVVRRDIRRAVVRRFPYVIYYRVVVDRVIVLAIIHGRANPKKWRSRN